MIDITQCKAVYSDRTVFSTSISHSSVHIVIPDKNNYKFM